MNRRAAGPTVIGIALALLLCLLVVPMLVVGGTAMLFAGGDGSTCGSTAAAAVQPTASTVAANSIPANYLHWFQFVGLQYNVPWTILAGIGKVESDDGQTTPARRELRIQRVRRGRADADRHRGASGDAWATYATVEDGNPPASVYDPADAIAAAAKYLIAHGVQQNVPGRSSPTTTPTGTSRRCSPGPRRTPAAGTRSPRSRRTATAPPMQPSSATPTARRTASSPRSSRPTRSWPDAVNYAEDQLGKPYLWGGTGPAAFDCSGLVMMAYQSAGVTIPRTSQQQWTDLPHVPASKVLPGDLVFFAGGDGTVKAPGHVGLVIGKHTMIEAYAPGTPIRVSAFGTPQSAPGDTVVVGYARPWSNKSTNT